MRNSVELSVGVSAWGPIVKVASLRACWPAGNGHGLRAQRLSSVSCSYAGAYLFAAASSSVSLMSLFQPLTGFFRPLVSLLQESLLVSGLRWAFMTFAAAISSLPSFQDLWSFHFCGGLRWRASSPPLGAGFAAASLAGALLRRYLRWPLAAAFFVAAITFLPTVENSSAVASTRRLFIQKLSPGTCPGGTPRSDANPCRAAMPFLRQSFATPRF